MNAKQRKQIADRIVAIATAAGGTVVVTPRERTGIGRMLSTQVDVTFPDVRVDIPVDGLHGGGLCAHWHGATRPLKDGPCGMANPYHRAKSTLCGGTAESFLAMFELAAKAVQSGDAFDDDWKPVPLRTA